jgi:hypothetical protein
VTDGQVKSNGVRLGVPAVGSTHLFGKDVNLMTAPGNVFSWARAATTIHNDTGNDEYEYTRTTTDRPTQP